MAKPLTCKDLVDQLIDYLEDDLDARARRLCDEHMALCHACRNYFQSYLATIRLAPGAFRDEEAEAVELGLRGAVPGEMPEYEMPEELVQSILRAAGVRDGIDPGAHPGPGTSTGTGSVANPGTNPGADPSA